MGRPRKPQFVYAKQAITIAVGASPVEYDRAKVYDRRKQEYVEVDLHMKKPVKEENIGTHYTFAAGEKIPADHPAAVAKPSAFMTADEADRETVEA